MFTLFIKSIVLFITLLLVLRVMGKRQIGEMQPFELAITLIVAEVAAIPMTDSSIPFVFGLIPILTLTVIHFFMSFAARKSLALRGMICGKPVIVISPNGVDYKNLKSLNMTMHDLLEATRGAGYFNLDEIEYAIFETNGKLCVLAKTEFQNATVGDLALKKPTATLPTTIIVDGKFVAAHLAELSVTEAMINRELKLSKLDSSKNIALATMNGNGDLYIQPYNAKYITRQMSK